MYNNGWLIAAAIMWLFLVLLALTDDINIR